MSDISKITATFTIERRYELALGTCFHDPCRYVPTHTAVLEFPRSDAEIPICEKHVRKLQENYGQ